MNISIKHEPSEFKKLVDDITATYYKTPWNEREDCKKEIITTLKEKDSAYIAGFTVYCFDTFKSNSYSFVCNEILPVLYKSNVLQSESDFVQVLTAGKEVLKRNHWGDGFPIILIIKQLKQYSAKHSLSLTFIDFLRNCHEQGDFTPYEIDRAKENDRVRSILLSIIQAASEADRFPPIRLSDKDSFGMCVNQTVSLAQDDEQNLLHGLLAHLKKAAGAKPSAKFMQKAKSFYEQLGDLDYQKKLAKSWLEACCQITIQSENRTLSYNDGSDYEYSTYFFIHEVNALVAKGFIWSLTGTISSIDSLLMLLTNITEKCYQKIPGQGPAAAGVGNACIYVLAQSGLAGVAHLSRLKLRIKQANTQELIEKYIQETATALNVSAGVIEDMAVMDYGLTNGVLQQEYGEYRATLRIQDIGKIDIQWTKANGSQLKSEPASVKKDHAVELKVLKATATDIAKNLTAQRDRLDRSLIQDRQWTWPDFSDYYINHGLMQFITHRLIWIFDHTGQSHEVFWLNDHWTTLAGEVLTEVPSDTLVRLWHPIGKAIENVLDWREFLNKNEIRQPIKQAFREVYLLTDVELNTRRYSNRMAAHILKQHQFNTLAKGRGWRYSLLGAYDKGYESDKAQIELPTYDLRAEFWVSEVDADGAWNDTGIYLYVSTDQVRFTRLATIEPIDLIDIPPLAFSEIMRDVDLFVGVASVGNDPNWRDGGLAQYRTYWENYSFGELGELAKTRRQALESLVPRLKISRVAEVKDRYLIVRGKLRTYKIHIGSGNILMEPNNQYLCIVPDRSSDKVITNVFLPFEGDSLLSVILSKAFLLADDDKITDPTITRQISLRH